MTPTYTPTTFHPTTTYAPSESKKPTFGPTNTYVPTDTQSPTITPNPTYNPTVTFQPSRPPPPTWSPTTTSPPTESKRPTFGPTTTFQPSESQEPTFHPTVTDQPSTKVVPVSCRLCEAPGFTNPDFRAAEWEYASCEEASAYVYVSIDEYGLPGQCNFAKRAAYTAGCICPTYEPPVGLKPADTSELNFEANGPME